MRLALLSWESKHSIAVGGLAEHVTELAAALHRRGHEVHVFTRIGEGQPGYDCLAGVHYHRCPYQPHPDFLVDNQRMCDSFVWHLAETERHINGTFDILHGHDWLSVRALTQAKDRYHRRVVMTIHSTEFGRCGNQLFEGPSRRIREIEWEGTYVAHRVICVSKALCSEVTGLYSVPPDKLNVIYNGVNVRRFDARIDRRSTRRACAVGLDDPLVLFAGRMTWQKGPDILVEALPGLLRRHPNTKFLFAGDGDLREGLQQRCAMLGVSPATRFLGYCQGRELVGLFKTADVVCVPSRNEPFGIVILEAWSARKPVVATRTGGPAEFVTHQSTGLTVADDRDSIGWGVSTVLADMSIGRRMGRNGRREAESKFTWDMIAAQTEQVYESVSGAGARVLRQAEASTQEIYGMAQQTRQKTASNGKKSGGTTSKAGSTKTARTASAARTASPKAGAPKTTTPRTGRRTQKTITASKLARGIEPTTDEIRERAYQIYLARAGAPGSAEQDWLQAESELRGS